MGCVGGNLENLKLRGILLSRNRHPERETAVWQLLKNVL